jgi:hypothetical protein
MFDWDNIRDGQSIAKLKALGGLAGLQQKLQTSFTVTPIRFRKVFPIIRRIMHRDEGITEITDQSFIPKVSSNALSKTFMMIF